MIIRKIKPSEIHLLENFLYDAIFTPDGHEKPAREIIKRPELSRYIDGFGRDADVCLVAELNQMVIGATWTRVFPETEKGYGYINPKTPELTVSVVENYRKLGIGTKLITSMIVELQQLGYEQVSLSVDKLNHAFEMYKKLGFDVVKSDEKSAIMLKNLNDLSA